MGEGPCYSLQVNNNGFEISTQGLLKVRNFGSDLCGVETFFQG